MKSLKLRKRSISIIFLSIVNIILEDNVLNINKINKKIIKKSFNPKKRNSLLDITEDIIENDIIKAKILFCLTLIIFNNT